MYLLLLSSTIVVCLKNPLVLDNGRSQGRHPHFLFEIYRSKVHNLWMQFLAYCYFPFVCLFFCSAYWMNQRESLRVFKSKFQKIFLVSWVKDTCFMPNSPARPHRFLMCSFFPSVRKKTLSPLCLVRNATTIRWSKSLLSLLVSGEVCLLIIHDMISSTDNGTLMIW